jgi:hypothetical protein
VTARRYAVALVVAVAALFVGAVVVNVAYTQRVSERADRRQAELRVQQDMRWCELFALMDPAGVPPTTERGERVQTQILRLRKEFHCEEKR